MTTTPSSRFAPQVLEHAMLVRPYRSNALAVLVMSLLVLASCSKPTERAVEQQGAAGAKGAADSVVTLDSAVQRLAGIELQPVARSSFSELTANGAITYDANHVSVVASRTEGRLVSVRADLGQAVLAGTVLAFVESPEVGGVRGDLERARANVEVARKNYDREKRLYDEQISPQKELLDAEGALRSAEADVNSALARIRALGAESGESGTFGLATSISGTVVERNASPGQTVGPSTNLFTVADLRHVWITVDVYEGDVTRVTQGAKATVIPSALQGELFAGRVTYAGGVVDTVSRTFKVRVELENPGSRLRPGMFAQVRIRTTGSERSAPIVVPEVAVQDLNGKPIVFVAGTAAHQFVARRLTVGAGTGNGMVTVTSGLSVGERIVVNGAFQLKAELTKSSFAGSE
ncbi:MAG: efflux RND transporter periplasmic adaptor subunit [Gemmatimonadaceae bacterium]